MTIKISPELARHIPPDRVDFLYRIRDQRAALLAEAQTAAADEHLSVWQAESGALVAALKHSFAIDESRIASFEDLVPGLEEKSRDLAVAVAVRDNALRVYSQGSPDRAAALRLRDDHDAAESARGWAFRSFQQAEAEAISILPSSSNFEAPPGYDVVSAIASYVVNKKFSPEYAVISAAAKSRWLAAPESEVMWWPLAARRLVKSAPREWEDAHRVRVALPRADFYLELAALKASRVAHRTAQLRAAQTLVENARAAVAAMATQ